MAKNDKKSLKDRFYDAKETFAPKIGEPLLKWLITFIPLSRLEKDSDAIDALSLLISYITSGILPDGSLFGMVSSDMLGRLPTMAKDRLSDWENAKQRLANQRLKKGDKRPVTDADYAEFENFLKFQKRDVSLAELQQKGGKIGKQIADALQKIDLSKIKDKFPDLKAWDQKLADKKIPEKIDKLTDKINRQSSKPFLKPNKVSKFFDQITNKLNHS